MEGQVTTIFLMSFQSDILEREVIRPECTETTALGAAYLSGLATGVYKDLKEISLNWKVDKIFTPSSDVSTKDERLKIWHKAVEYSKNWARDSE